MLCIYKLVEEWRGQKLILSPQVALPDNKKELHGTYLGRHILAEFFDCDSNIINSVDLVEKYMTNAAIKCGATVVQKCFHMFSPHGVSGVVIISESHLAIHTWPELGYAAVDLFTCGESCDPKVAYDYLKKVFSSKKGSFSILKRGILSKDMLRVDEKPFEIKEQIS